MATQIQERENGRIITANHRNEVASHGLIVPMNIILTLNVDENPHIGDVQDILTEFCERNNVVECFNYYETERANERQIRFIFS